MSFKQRLQQKEQLLGTMLTLPSAEVAEMISNCGFDWLFIDGEHGPLATLDCQRLLQAVAGHKLHDHKESAVLHIEVVDLNDACVVQLGS